MCRPTTSGARTCSDPKPETTGHLLPSSLTGQTVAGAGRGYARRSEEASPTSRRDRHMMRSTRGRKSAEPPKWIKPQLARLADDAPAGPVWFHEIKYDGYRMHARLARGGAVLLTRIGLDWSLRYRFTIEALRSLPVQTV